ncbi:Annexin A7 [Orchesella cincta]|uniref:Annexin A7 n=1 Tax=Orchesella cincta TaxID=48709 RepID=A0A1D2MSL0_ORCCI|nr:Annexin A7 [Orchesella cincta]
MSLVCNRIHQPRMDSFCVWGKNPTIVPHAPFDAGADATILRSAMKRFGTNEGQIIAVVTKRTLEQRQQIVSQYEKQYNRIAILANSEKSIVPIPFPVEHDEGSKEGTRWQSIGVVGGLIFCCLDAFTLDEIVQSYKKQYSKDMKDDVKKDVSGDYGLLLQALMEGKRRPPSSTQTRGNSSMKVAKKLVKAGVGIWLGTDEKPIIKIFSKCSFKELAEISKAYFKFTSIPLAKSLATETSGNFRELLLKILHYAENPINHYALLLQSALQHSNLNLFKDINRCRTVVRILVTRSEIDLMDIEERYSVIATKSLEADVKAATSSDFQKACLNIIQGNK